MPHHLETDCLLTPLACPYHELGCTAKVSTVIVLFVLIVISDSVSSSLLAITLWKLLAFYFRLRAFSIQRARLSRSLEQAITLKLVHFHKKAGLQATIIVRESNLINVLWVDYRAACYLACDSAKNEPCQKETSARWVFRFTLKRFEVSCHLCEAWRSCVLSESNTPKRQPVVLKT